MKKLIYILFLAPILSFAQVGLGTEEPRGMLDISSSDAGLVVPRVSSVDAVTDGNGGEPVDGTVVYDISRNQTCFRINGNWICTCDDSGSTDFNLIRPKFSTVSNYFKASNAETQDQFGHRVSMSEDGSRLAVSSRLEDSNATGINGNQSNNSASGAGAVYIFRRDGNIWTQEAYMKSSNTEANDAFGVALSLSDDGTRLAVSATGEDSNATGVNGNQSNNSAASAGAVYIFLRTGTNWTQEAYIKASNTQSGDGFGNAGVSMNADGSRLAVGAYAEDSNATGINGNQSNNSAVDSGAAYVFSRSGTTWTQEAYIKASNTETEDYFGRNLDISGDGTRLAVGAAYEDSSSTGINGGQGNGASRSGAIYVFSRSGSTWTQEAYVKASNTGGNDFFGSSMSLDHSGTRLAVTAGGDDSNSSGINGSQTGGGANDNYGSVFVFKRDGTTWAQEAYIKASNPNTGDQFGTEVKLSKNGFKLAVSAIGESSNSAGLDGNQSNNSASFSSAVYVFTRCGESWIQESYVKTSNPDTNDTAAIISLSGNGKYLAIGAKGESSNATGINGNQNNNSSNQSGAVYIIE